ncbi:hypothetical protein [Burkholderia sp. Bp8992]|uniref:hypothetical protein n=1 Tax=Burkholderia sp. Bp8992 TaxID=2184554 RepID=UPI000F56659E|nr:hypothetical protein [Burkholderia sp. Bp8992]
MRKFLSDPAWTFVGVVVALCIGLISILPRSPGQLPGVLHIQRTLAMPMFGTAELLTAGNAPKFGLTLNGQALSMGHIQLRNYALTNLSGRHLEKSDFESPITISAVQGQKILYVGITPAPGHAPIDVALNGDSQAVISPMLLNINEAASINIILYKNNKDPVYDNAYSDDSGVLNWTADIRGADLNVSGLPRPEPSWFQSHGIVLYVLHADYAVIALVLAGFILSGLQIKRHDATEVGRRHDLRGIVVLSMRVSLAWIAADVLVRIFDNTIIPIAPWNNWSVIVLYVASMFFPLPIGFAQRGDKKNDVDGATS